MATLRSETSLLPHANCQKTSALNWCVLPLLLILLVTGYLFWVASYIKIDYYDSFLILLNARCVATGDPLGYSGSRPTILPITLSPFFLIEKLIGRNGFAFVACHVFMMVFFVLFLWISYRLFRLNLSKKYAITAVLLMSLNTVLVHAAPYCKEDVFAAFLLTTAFYFYLQASLKNKKMYYLFSGLLIAPAIGVRYNFPILFAVIFLYEFLSGASRLTWSPLNLFVVGKNTKLKILLLFILPIALFILIVSFHYSALGISPFMTAFKKYITEPVLYMANLVKKTYPLPPIYNFIFLIKACTWPIVLCFVLGIIISYKSIRSGTTLFCLLWFLVFFGLHTFFVPQKEARFLIPIFPPLYFFATIGLEKLLHYFKSSNIKVLRTTFFQVALSLGILALPMKQVVAECIQFRDPVYHVDFPKKLSEYAAHLAGPNAIHWIGPFYPLHPKNYIFHIEDVTYYIHHLYMSAIFLHTHRFVSNLEHAQFLIPDEENAPIFVGRNAGLLLNDGDALVINLEKEGYNTKSLPKTLKPLYVERARKLYFDRATPVTAQPMIFNGNGPAGSAIECSITTDGFNLAGKNIPDGLYEVYMELEEPSTTLSLVITNVKNGEFHFSNPSFHNPIPIKRIFLFYFDSLRKFTIPE